MSPAVQRKLQDAARASSPLAIAAAAAAPAPTASRPADAAHTGRA